MSLFLAKRSFLLIAVVLAIVVGIVWQAVPTGKEFTRAIRPPVTSESARNVLAPVLPLQAIEGLDPKKVALGERLFHDARLSRDFSTSCASCHNIGRGGVDGRRFSLGIGGAEGKVNAPTVFNSAFSLAQFWDGRAPTLEAQVAGPVHNPIEMGSNWAQVLGRLALDDEIATAFSEAYPSTGLTPENLMNAIATYERSLVTTDSRFDRYLRGNRQALSATELEGYRRFREFGCISCHQGKLLGGNMFQRFGVMGDYFAGRTMTESDLGRFNVTRREEDRHVFKVPSLRNVALTAPYFHDGSAKTLEEAVNIMGRYQLGRELSISDTETIVAFLKTLTGQLPNSSDK